MPAQKKKPIVRKKRSSRKTKAEVMVSVAKEIQQRRSKPRKMVEWFKGLREKRKIVYAVGIIFTGIYLALNPEGRKAFVTVFKRAGDLVTEGLKTVSGGVGLAANTLHYAGKAGEKTAKTVNAVDKAVTVVGDLASAAGTKGSRFIDAIVLSAEEVALKQHSTLDGILDIYSAYTLDQPLHPHTAPTRMHETKEDFLRNWIPFIQSYEHGLQLLKNQTRHRGDNGYRAFRDKSQEKITQAFTEKLKQYV